SVDLMIYFPYTNQGIWMAYWMFLTDLLAQRLNFHFKKSLLLGLLFFHLSCSGSNPVSDLLGSISSKVASSKVAQKVGKYLPTSSREFGDIYAMESQVRNHREWVQDKAKELKVTKKILGPLLNKSRQNDFQFYEYVDANLDIMTAAHKNILSNAKTEKKLIIRVQKSKRLDIESKIPGKEKTFRQQFITLDNAIIERKLSYEESILKIEKAVEKRDMKLVFITKQKDDWFFISQELFDRRMELQPKINNLTSEVVNAVADSGNYIEIIGIRLNKVERLNRKLDQLDKFFVVIDKIAEKEKGGRVFIRKDPEKKEGYELRFEKSVEAYETHLEDLNMLLSD
ncbi:MAG: hypothetical protein QGF31_00905, partial [Nitrospinota bacterium]|nr:hypothetical protein [Nitrospinota bacterium]